MAAITVKDVWKKYRLYHDKGSTLKERLLFRNRNFYEESWVLKGIDLQIEKGEAIGLIGENGSGKSTLLKLLTKIIYPNRGEIIIDGKVSSLLELGAGFHPDMTGRENIYMNASIFGLTRSEIKSKLNQIIAFSELADHIDNTVRTYSSGMYMRLAFSVAINVDADILLIDEILAVGDATFQARCFEKLQKMKNDGVTIVIVSHDLGSIERYCSKAVWLNQSEIQAVGNPYNITRQYLEAMAAKRQENYNNLEVKNAASSKEKEVAEANPNRFGNKYYELSNVKMLNAKNEDKRIFKSGEKVTISFDYIKNNEAADNPNVGFGIFRNDGTNCYGTNTQIDKIEKISTNSKGNIKIVIDELALIEGEYILDIAIENQYGTPYDYIKGVTRFSVYSEIKDIGIVRFKHHWLVDDHIFPTKLGTQQEII